MRKVQVDPAKFRSVRKEILVQLIFLLGILRETIFFGFRGVLCPSDWLTLTGPCTWFDVTFRLLVLALGALLTISELYWERDWKGFIQTCRSNWLVLSFTGLAGLSLFWSIQFNISLYKFLDLLSMTLMALYIGHIFGLKKLLNSLRLFFNVTILLSLILAIFFPEYNIMAYPFYRRAWSGVFFHRNYLGAFMALGVPVFLINLQSNHKAPIKPGFYLDLLSLILCVFLLFMSQSATGIITTLILLVVIALLFIWIKWSQKIKPYHYVGFVGLSMVTVILVLANLDYFLGFLGRNASLTGRVPMWKFLLQNVINQRPWLGYGYGAIWHLQGFVIDLMYIVNWGTPVVLGDNGYIDILVHLGFVGLVVFFTLVVFGFIRGIRFLLQHRSITASFPILVLVFGVVANISLSLIAETESLVWVIILATLVSIQNEPVDDSINSTD